LRACDFAVVLDETLMGSQVADGIRVGQNGAGAGALLVNSVRPATTWSGLAVRIIALDMSTIARTVLGRPIVNTGMMGALVAASGAVPLDAVVRAVESEMPATLAAKNAQMLRQGYDLCGEALDV
jgi:pyruvate ferredoxin oxidoreductase gamma subunit